VCDTEKTIGNIIDKQKVCHLSSVDSDGFPNIKAMLRPRKRDGIKHIYLSTNTSSVKVAQFKANDKACLYFTDSRFFRGVMLIGTAEVKEDSKHKEMIWEQGDTMYYPQGVTDPDYCVLKFTAHKGRYYSKFKSEDFEV
jgi:general stress protein 26